ncbi:MAG: AAC(3) family N-acetyltransferase [Acinetobacter sp.]
MSEQDQIEKTSNPITIDRLIHDLQKLGLKHGDTVIVHSSLSALGWVNGGAIAVIKALLETVGSKGNVCMPAHSSHISDPANWNQPPVPESWIQTIRDTMPVFEATTTPTRDMGQIAELFRTWPKVVRSDHPFASFCAIGPAAEEITKEHVLDDPFGEQSPLAKLYQLKAKVLLLGVDFNRCTALHLAENRAFPNRKLEKEGAPFIENGTRKWVEFYLPEFMDVDKFIPIGKKLVNSKHGERKKVGEAYGILIDMQLLVDHAVSTWTHSSHD